ncbi:hypothetical protein OJAV_G00027550 [Oryzias javanicus]|uniref:Transmembrane channel-like protein n=1 Tax=Oryzias javanicus TaxID=123683 RepID=A0A3S2N709_ORYJA|nr:hypothetical protein OJAV_G00027550 [Oryzias javanicus]
MSGSVLCVQLPPSLSNWSDSSSFLATGSQSEVVSVSTRAEVPVSPHHSSTAATLTAIAAALNVSHRNAVATSVNQTAVFEKNNRSQQDQCWETYVGQEMLKLSIIDMIFTVASILLIDFIRGLVVRYLSDCCCWDLESKFPEYGEFKIAENVLHLIYNQGMIWMGAFFSPCLPAFNVLKLIGLMYLRSWAVLTCNVPHQQVFRASRSNNFYLAMLLFMLFLCMLPTIFAIARYKPSQHCGPFSGQEKIYDIISETVASDFPLWFSRVMSYVSSPVVVLPAVLLLFMLIYYLQAIARSLKFTNNQLRMQLQTERMEDKKKVFQLAAARLQTPETTEEQKPDQQLSDAASPGPSVHTDSAGSDGSEVDLRSPANSSSNIQTIAQAASRPDLSRGGQSPAATGASRAQPPRLPNRRALRALHPVQTAGAVSAQSYDACRGHSTRLVLVNEHEPRKKLLRSATRIPRHYVVEKPAEILELYPRNVRRYTPRPAHHLPHPHRCHVTQHLTRCDGERERSRTVQGKVARPRSLSDLQQQTQFYLRKHLDGHKDGLRVRYAVQENDLEDGEVDWGDPELHSSSRSSLRTEPAAVRTRHHVCPPAARSKTAESSNKRKLKAHPETESDSASLASSSDQQNSSSDQYLQVIHSKQHQLRSESTLTKHRSEGSFSCSPAHGFVCSNV